jgi:hypothetical protein
MKSRPAVPLFTKVYIIKCTAGFRGKEVESALAACLSSPKEGLYETLVIGPS